MSRSRRTDAGGLVTSAPDIDQRIGEPDDLFLRRLAERERNVARGMRLNITLVSQR